METAGINATTRFLHAEWGGDSHAGRHMEVNKETGRKGIDNFDIEAADRNGDWSESYIIRLFDWHLKEQETMPRLTGEPLLDFQGLLPLRCARTIHPLRQSEGGGATRRHPERELLRLSILLSSKPMLHIYGHSWPVRWGKPGEPKEILVYSNCPEVELFVNGVSQGRKKRNSQDFPAAGLRWNVPLREGNNKITATGYDGKLRLDDEIQQEYQTRTWGKPSRILLTQTAQDAETILVQAELIDENGIRCLDACLFIEFGCTDSEALLRNQGTAQGSLRIQAANGRASIRVNKAARTVVVSASDSKRILKTALISVSGQ